MQRLKTSIMALCACGMCVGGTVAQDQERPERRPAQRFGGGFMSTPLMRALDANRDGRISPEEIQRATPALRALDRDRDGALSFEEMGITQRPGFSAGRPGGFSRGGGGSSRSGASRISRSGLVVGSALPEVTIFDEQGKSFDLKQLKGGHTVVVFGCLT
ncbi:MAG: hypothetical protein ABGZ17_00720 [Planctomycetaceae bacterium]